MDDVTETQKHQLSKYFGKICYTDNKIKLLSAFDENCEVYDKQGTYNVWHFSLDDGSQDIENSKENHGVYANGLLVESCSPCYMKELL